MSSRLARPHILYSVFVSPGYRDVRVLLLTFFAQLWPSQQRVTVVDLTIVAYVGRC